MQTKPLSANNRKELKKWLAKQNCKNKKLHKECADCGYVAELVQKLGTDLCSASEYSSNNGKSYKMRLENWQRFNDAVLTKFWLRRSQNQLECYAHAQRYASEHLLYDIMRRAKFLALEQKHEEEEKEADFVTVSVYETVGTSIVKGVKRMADWSKYEAALEESYGQNNFLGLAQQKFQQLEFKTSAENQEMLQRSREAMAVQSLQVVA